MHFGEGAWWRPLFEDTQATLQLGVGCSHNACRFCTMYKKARFSLSPRDREAVLAYFDQRIASWDESRLRMFRGGIKTM